MPLGGLRLGQGLMQHTKSQKLEELNHHPVLTGQAFSTFRHISLPICMLTLSTECL